MRRPIVVARAVLLRPDGHVLLGLRKETGRWEFPGGKVDDETVVGAAVREAEEETGIRLGAPRCLLGYVDAVSLTRGRRSVDIFHLFEDWEGEEKVREDSHEKWAWFPALSPPPRAQLMPSTHHCFAHFISESHV